MLRLHVPVWLFWTAKLPKVSSRLREYSRFQETIDGDLVRYGLPPEGASFVRSEIAGQNSFSGV
jgi:hypothetical protein